MNFSRLFGVDAEYMYYGLGLKPSVMNCQGLPDASGHMQSISLDGIVTVPAMSADWNTEFLASVSMTATLRWRTASFSEMERPVSPHGDGRTLSALTTIPRRFTIPHRRARQRYPRIPRLLAVSTRKAESRIV
jgi:hypothetical protein